MNYRTLLSTIVALGLTGSPGFAQTPQDSGLSKTLSTQMAVRDLWIDHIFWIRSVVIAAANEDEAARTEAETQAVENAKKIADVIEPFYGKPASEKLFELLAGHYGAVKDYLTATVPALDNAQQKIAVEKLAVNAQEIATFLSEANPNLPKETLSNLLRVHGGHHLAQIDQVRKNDFGGEARTWMEMKQHIYILADALVGGIVKQFPDKF